MSENQSGWQQRIAAMDPWRHGSAVDRCFFCGAGYDYTDAPKHRPDCLWQIAKDAGADPIAAAVDEQLDPLKDALIAMGRTLAKDGGA